MKPIIVVPTYNEKENLPELLKKIFALNIHNLEIIIVDDNSPDGTQNVIKEWQIKYPVHLIARTKKMGLGSAYIAGFKKALDLGADFILEMDADLSHDPTDVPRLISAGKTGVDLVIGSRKIPGGKIIGWNARRHLMSNCAMRFARIFLGLKTKDVTAGFRCFARHVLEKIDLNKIKSNGYAFQEEMLYLTERLKFKVVEVPVTFTDRQSGQSKLNKKDIWEFFKVMMKLKIS